MTTADREQLAQLATAPPNSAREIAQLERAVEQNAILVDALRTQLRATTAELGATRAELETARAELATTTAQLELPTL